jgi:hypothetical protein
LALGCPALLASCGRGTGVDAGNTPPEVTLSGGGSCHPGFVFDELRPCAVTFRAVARDRDGDPVRLAWEGCTSGSGETAECRIDRPGTFTARVVASDGRGGQAQATAQAEGSNRPPRPALQRCFAYCCVRGTCSCDDGLPPGQAATCWWDGDDDLDPDGDRWSCVRASVRGACSGGAFGACGGLGNAIEVDFQAGSGGACEVEAVVRDSWGAEQTVAHTVAVRAP